MFRTRDTPVWRRAMEYSHPDNRGCNISRNIGNILLAHNGIISQSTSIFIHTIVRYVNLVCLGIRLPKPERTETEHKCSS
jgi:hypothetical protein